MSPSSPRSAIFLAAALAAGQPALAAEPRPISPWLDAADESADTGVFAPLPEAATPTPANPPNAADRADALASDLAGTAIGVDRLPPLGKAMSSEIWVGSPDPDIRAALDSANATPIRAANRLLRLILSTPTDPSARPAAGARAKALLRLGAVPEALATAHAAPTPTPEVLETVTLAALLYGRNARPCRHAAIGRAEVNIPGLAGIYCEALLGSAKRAAIKLELQQLLEEVPDLDLQLTEEALHPDPDSPPALPATGEISDLAAGIASSLGLPFPERHPQRAPYRQLWLHLGDVDAGSRADLPAMARLEAAGLFATAELRRAIWDAESDPADEFGVWTAVLQQLADIREPAAFGRLLAASLRLGREQGREATAARLIAPTARNRSLPEDGSLPPSLIRRLFLLAEDPDTALLWLEESPTPETAMRFAVALGGDGFNWTEQDELALEERFLNRGDNRAGHLLAAARAFGLSQADGVFPPAGFPAARNGSGLIALEALRLLEAPDIEPDRLEESLRGLVQAGFVEHARRIAVEVLLLGA